MVFEKRKEFVLKSAPKSRISTETFYKGVWIFDVDFSSWGWILWL